jgi:predicted Zn-dependent protease
MNGLNFNKFLFIFWIIIALQSIIWIIFNIFNVNLILTQSPFQFVFILSCLSFIVSILTIRKLLAEVKNILKEERFNQRNVKDVYMYSQLLDPPDSGMYN